MISPPDNTAVPPAPVRLAIILIAIACAVIVLMALSLIPGLWQSLIGSASSGPAVVTLFQVVLPSTFLGLALASRLFSIATAWEGAWIRLRASHLVALLTLPLLWFPVTFFGATTEAWRSLLSYGFMTPPPGTPVPSREIPMACAVVAFIGALHGWLNPRATLRSWLRVMAIATACLIALSFVVISGSRTATMRDVSNHAQLLGQLVFACVVTLLLTRPTGPTGEAKSSSTMPIAATADVLVTATSFALLAHYTRLLYGNLASR